MDSGDNAPQPQIFTIDTSEAPPVAPAVDPQTPVKVRKSNKRKPRLALEDRPKPESWKKKKPKAKPKDKRHGVVGREWTWGHLNTFQPMERWTRKGRLTRPAPRNTIPGCVYYAMKRVKKGNDDTVHQAALADGLASLTVQNTYNLVQWELRTLARLGVIKRTRRPKYGVKRER